MPSSFFHFFGGLSPLARGTPKNRPGGNGWGRFIPAGAGNSVFEPAVNFSHSVYPRWRGELIDNPKRDRIENGLSPLARGTLQHCPTPRGHFRFIPAGAGNSVAASISCSIAAVYPRWRGELAYSVSPLDSAAGLSPLARGTHMQHAADIVARRFIPAGAGNSNLLLSVPYRVPVYPRWRGELTAATIANGQVYGLSPLARGTRTYRRPGPLQLRFIPAGAGNSRIASMAAGSVPVYPRWRGELSSLTSCLARLNGLSPLARGTPKCLLYWR